MSSELSTHHLICSLCPNPHHHPGHLECQLCFVGKTSLSPLGASVFSSVNLAYSSCHPQWLCRWNDTHLEHAVHCWHVANFQSLSVFLVTVSTHSHGPLHPHPPTLVVNLNPVIVLFRSQLLFRAPPDIPDLDFKLIVNSTSVFGTCSRHWNIWPLSLVLGINTPGEDTKYLASPAFSGSP